MTLGIFFWGANIKHIGVAIGFAQPLHHRGLFNPGHTCAEQQGQGRGSGFAAIVVGDVAKTLGSAFDQIQPCQRPP